MMKTLGRLLLLACFLSMTLISYPASAQTAVADGWSMPINLSRSGAASAPSIFASARGVHVFWMNRFDGLTSTAYTPQAEAADPYAAITDLESWSGKISDFNHSVDPEDAPVTIAVGVSRIHAFWLEPNLYDTQLLLRHSQRYFDNGNWSSPDTLASGVAAFSVVALEQHDLGVAYIRSTPGKDVNPGIFWTIQIHESVWSSHVEITSSMNFRLSDAQNSTLQLVNAGTDQLYAIWQDPYLLRWFSAESYANGTKWQTAVQLTEGDELFSPEAVKLQFAKLGSDSLKRIWQVRTGTSTCETYAQDRIGAVVPAGEQESGQLASSSWSPLAVFTATEQICQAGTLLYQPDGINSLVMVSGKGTEEIQLSLGNPQTMDWAAPITNRFTFEDEHTKRQVSLQDLDFTLVGDQLLVVGLDLAQGDVWLVSFRFSSLARETTSVETETISAWSPAVQASSEMVAALDPDIEIDASGQVYLVWVERNGSVLNRINLAQWNGESLSRAVELFGQEDGAMQPDLAIDQQGNLHMVWASQSGEIYYSRVTAGQGITLGSWAPPEWISPGQSKAVLPKIAVLDPENIVVLYVVPLNEGRGIYIARFHKDTWSKGQMIFDAAEEGLTILGDPSLAVSPAGELHYTWSNKALPDFGITLDTYYFRSLDFGQTWESPSVLAGQGYGKPQVAASASTLALLLERQDRGVFYRWLDPNSANQAAWGSVELLEEGAANIRYGLTSSAGSRLYVASARSQRGKVQIALWERASNTSWQRVDPSAVSQPAARADTVIFPTYAAAQKGGGLLAIAWFQEQAGLPTLFISSRTIPVDEIPAGLAPILPTVAPSPSPTAGPTDFLQPATVMPISNDIMPPDNDSLSLLLGVVLAGFVVAAVFAGNIFYRRMH